MLNGHGLPPRLVAAACVHRLFGAAAQYHFTDRVLNAPNWLYRSTLDRDGILIVPGYFAHLPAVGVPTSAMRYEASGKYWALRQPLTLHPEYAAAAADPVILELVRGYFRRDAWLVECDYRQTDPLDLHQHEREDPKYAMGYSASHWHYDTRGKQIKAMIYLGDVGPGDQNFVYCPGTHRGWHRSDYASSRKTDAQMEGTRAIEVYAPRGTLILFDTNGIHRQRRTLKSARHSMTFNYAPGIRPGAHRLQLHPDTSADVRERLGRMALLA